MIDKELFIVALTYYSLTAPSTFKLLPAYLGNAYVLFGFNNTAIFKPNKQEPIYSLREIV